MDPVIDNEKTAKNIPVFSLGNPFDNIKIIAHTIMGSPRLNYDWNGYNIVAKTLKNEEVFSVISNIKTDHEYAESMLTVDKMNDFAEFGKLFYEFGSGALNAIAVALMNTSGNKRPLCLSEDFYSIKKLGIVFSKQFRNFQSLIKVTEYENEQEYYSDQDQHLDISNFIDEVNNKPIVLSGITSTSLNTDYNGKKFFLTNTHGYKGASGSPVFRKMDNEYDLVGIMYGNKPVYKADELESEIPDKFKVLYEQTASSNINANIKVEVLIQALKNYNAINTK